MLRSSSPRFVAYASGPVYGSRDEIVGSTPWQIEATAETMAWLTRQLDALPEYYGELAWRVVDNNPERDLANWGPVPAPKAIASDDLPF